MSDYDKVVENEEGITVEQLSKLMGNTVKDCEVYINIPNPKKGGFPIAVKLKSASSQFGCLYIDAPELTGE